MAERAAPRLLTRAALRSYLGNIAWAEVEARMARGKLPRPLWKLPADAANARWDLRAVDRAIDAESDMPASLERQTRELDIALGLA